MKPGWKSTEFYLTALTQFVGAFAASGMFGDDHWSIKLAGIISMALSGMGYTYSRASVKNVASEASEVTKRASQ